MASSMGIKTDRIDALTFGLGSGVAGMAGVALSQIDNVSPNLGQSYIIDSFLVVVFGGVGNLMGTLVGALTPGMGDELPAPPPELRHRQLPRGGVRRRRQPHGHARRRAHAGHGEQAPGALRRRGPWQ